MESNKRGTILTLGEPRKIRATGIGNIEERGGASMNIMNLVQNESNLETPYDIHGLASN